MPFVSQAQRRYMFSQHPDIAKRFAAETPKGADLPEHVNKFADGGSVMAGQAMPQTPLIKPPQPLELPPVNYKPYKPNPRTTRSLAKRSYAISSPSFRLGGSGRGAGVDRFSPLGTSPMFTGGGDYSLPGFTGPGMAPTMWDQQQELPGFSRGGVVSFADGGDVDYSNPDFYGSDYWNMSLDQIAQAQEDERRRQAAAAAAQEAQVQATQPQAIEQGRRDYQTALQQLQSANEMAQLRSQPFAENPQTAIEQPGVTFPNTPLGGLQAQRYNPNDPTAGNVAPDAAAQLARAAAASAMTLGPGMAFAPFDPAVGILQTFAGMGLQGAMEESNLPGVAKTVIPMLPYAAGGLAEGLAQPELRTGIGLFGNRGLGESVIGAAPAQRSVADLLTRTALETAAVAGAPPAWKQTGLPDPNIPGFGPLSSLVAMQATHMGYELFKGSQMAQTIGDSAVRLNERMNPITEPLRRFITAGEEGAIRGPDYGKERVEADRKILPGEVLSEKEAGIEPGLEREYISGPRTAFSGAGATWNGPQLPPSIQGPAEATNLRLPGGEPIGNVVGQEPLRPGLPPPGMTASDTAAINAALEKYKAGQPVTLADMLGPEPEQALLNAGPTLRGLLPEQAFSVNPAERVPTEPVQGEGFTASAPYPGRQAPEYNPTDLRLPRTDQAPLNMKSAAEMDPNELVATADRLGVDADRNRLLGILRDPELRQQEIDKVQAALDKEQEQAASKQLGKMGSAETDVFDAMREERIAQQQAIEREARRREVERAAQEQRQIENAWMNTGPKKAVPGRPSSVLGTIGRAINELGYFALGGDMGYILRQDIKNVVNPLKLPETLQVMKAAWRSLGDEEQANGLMDHFQNLQRTKELGVEVPFADWRGGSNVGRETGISEISNRGWLRNLNRAQAMWINARRALATESGLQNNPGLTDKGQAQDLANVIGALTGRGNIGTSLQKAGPLFTSLRYLASIPESTGRALLPWDRLSDGSIQMFGPVWKEAASRQAGWASGTLMLMGIAKAAGANVGIDPRRITSSEMDPGFGRIRIGHTDYDLTGGAAKFLSTVVAMAQGQKNGKDYPAFWGEVTPSMHLIKDGQVVRSEPARFGGTLAEYLRNSAGPMVSIPAELAKLSGLVDKNSTAGKALEFLHPDYFDKGPLNTGSPVDQALGKVSFLWMQDVARSVAANGTGASGLVSVPLSFFGANSTTIEPGAQTQRADILNDRDELARAFKGDQAQVERVQGDEYKDLGPREKRDVNAARDPADVARVEQQARADNNIFQQASDLKDEIRQSYNPAFDRLQQLLNQPNADAHAINVARNALYAEMNSRINGVQVQGLNGADLEQSPIQQAVQGYNNLYNIKDPDAREKAQQQYILAIDKQYGRDFAQRLSYNVSPQINEQNHPLIQTYQRAQAETQPYFSIPVKDQNDKVGQQKREDYLVANPHTNVTLAYLYGNSLKSVDAARMYEMEHPGATRRVDIEPGGYQPVVPYRNLAAAGGAPLVTYEALPGDKKDDYLATNPSLNALLWKTGHTAHLYSLQAYDILVGRS